MKIKIITLLLLFVLTKAGMSQNVDRTTPSTYDILYKSLSRNFNKVLFPLYYPNGDMKNWIDSSFFIHVVFQVDSAGFISKYQITNAIKSEDSITLSKIFAPIVQSRFHVQERALHNKSLSINIFCYSAAESNQGVFWGGKFRITLNGDDLGAINHQEVSKNNIVLPIMNIPILLLQNPPKQVVLPKVD